MTTGQSVLMIGAGFSGEDVSMMLAKFGVR